MLCNGAKVRILRSGAMALVQDLEPGELIFDPLCDCYRVIEDIHMRRIARDEFDSGEFERLRPILIPEGAFGDGRPWFGMWVSPCQPFIVCRQLESSTGGYKNIFEISADQLLSEGKGVRDSFFNHFYFQYYLLLFDGVVFMEVNGVLLKGVDIKNIVGVDENIGPLSKAQNILM